MKMLNELYLSLQDMGNRQAVLLPKFYIKTVNRGSITKELALHRYMNLGIEVVDDKDADYYKCYLPYGWNVKILACTVLTFLCSEGGTIIATIHESGEEIFTLFED